MVLALAALEKNDHKWTGRWLFATALLGAHFVGNQVYEFYTFAVHDGLRLSTNLFGSTFFTLTGFHGAHVTGGVIWLMGLWWQLKRGPAEQGRLHQGRDRGAVFGTS